ncbi:MAG: hypothetical protein ACYCSN_14505 [Acidobacteriaceae bacterium]
MSTISKWIMYVIVAAIVVLVVTHAVGFSQDVTAAGSQGVSGLKLLTGQGQTGGTTGSVSTAPNGTYSISA